ncbi:MAG: YbaK/EbsC family protein [Nitriliruptoraceae bacterium]
MARSAQRFAAFADDHGLELDVREFDAGTRTAADAAAAIGCDVAQIVKSLVFIAGGTPVLVLTSGANRVDESRLAALRGVDAVRPATADEVREATGYAIGGTPPFGHRTPLDVICDADLCAFDVVWAAAGTPRTVFAIDPDMLIELTGAHVTEV